MPLTIETLEGVEASLKADLARESTLGSDRSPAIEHGIRIGIAHHAIHRVAGDITLDGNWPVEYRKPLLQEVARTLAPITAPYGVTTEEMLAVKPEELIRRRELDRLGHSEQYGVREMLGPEAADRLFNRIQRESIEAFYGMDRRGDVFNRFDHEGVTLECPKASNAVLFGLTLGDPQRLPPGMKLLSESLIHLNAAKEGRADYPPMAEFKERVRDFYTHNEADFLPHAIENGGHAGELVFWDHQDHLPAIQPETWARGRETIRLVAGDTRFADAENEILQVGLDRLENKESAFREQAADKLRRTLGDSLSPEVRAAVDDPSPEKIAAARTRHNLRFDEMIDPEDESLLRKAAEDDRLRGQLRGVHRDALHPPIDIPPGPHGSPDLSH